MIYREKEKKKQNSFITPKNTYKTSRSIQLTGNSYLTLFFDFLKCISSLLPWPCNFYDEPWADHSQRQNSGLRLSHTRQWAGLCCLYPSNKSRASRFENATPRLHWSLTSLLGRSKQLSILPVTWFALQGGIHWEWSLFIDSGSQWEPLGVLVPLAK